MAIKFVGGDRDQIIFYGGLVSQGPIGILEKEIRCRWILGCVLGLRHEDVISKGGEG